MKTKNLVLCILLLSAVSCLAQVRQDHVSFYAGDQSGESYGSFIKTDADGNYFVAGRSNGYGTKFDYALIKYSSSGVVMWERRYNGEANSHDEPFSLLIDTKGNAYVTGSSIYLNNNKLPECVTIKYDRDGNTVWINKYRNSVNQSAAGRSMCVDSEGNLYIAGSSPADGISDTEILKINTAGKTVWSRSFNSNSINNDYTNIIQIYKDHVYVCGGGVVNAGQGSDYILLKYDVNGNYKWHRTHNGNLNAFDVARAIHVDNNQNIYITGYTENRGTKLDITTIKYDSEGNVLWITNHNGTGNGYDWPNHVLTDSYGNVYVEGGTQNEVEINPECQAELGKCRNDATLIKYMSTGEIEWIRLYNRANMYDCLQGMIIDKDNNIFVAGRSHGEEALTDDDIITMKFNSQGDRLWFMKYNSGTGRKDYGNAITIDNNGNVYTSGWSNFRGDYDFIAIKYAAVDLSDNVTDNVSVENYPNPFNPSTNINFNLKSNSYVKVTIFDISGREITQLGNTFFEKGSHSLLFNASDYSSGTYFYKLEAEGSEGEKFFMTKKMILLK